VGGRRGNHHRSGLVIMLRWSSGELAWGRDWAQGRGKGAFPGAEVPGRYKYSVVLTVPL